MTVSEAAAVKFTIAPTINFRYTHYCHQRHGSGPESRTSNQAFDLSESLRRKLANRAPATTKKSDQLGSNNSGVAVSLRDWRDNKSPAFDPKATVANVSYREFQLLCSDCLAQMLDQESPFRRPGIPFYLLCVYTSRMASTTKLG